MILEWHVSEKEKTIQAFGCFSSCSTMRNG